MRPGPLLPPPLLLLLFLLQQLLCVAAGAQLPQLQPHAGAPAAQQAAQKQLPTFQLPYGRGLCDVHVGQRNLCDCDLPRSRVSCHCPPQYQEEVVLRSRGDAALPPNLRELLVSGCARVRVVTAAFAGLPELRRVDIRGAQQLRVEPYGLSWNESAHLPPEMLPVAPPDGLSVNLTNCSVPELPSFAFLGRLDSVALVGVRVGAVRPFAFASLRFLRRLLLLDCDIAGVESQAFKKFSVDQLTLQGGRVRGALPSRAFTDLDVRQDLTIDGVALDSVDSAAFKVHSPRRFRLLNSSVGLLRGEAFSIVVHGPIFIQNNRFLKVETGAFLGVSVDSYTAKTTGSQTLRFDNNTLRSFQDGAAMFNTTGIEVRMTRVLLDLPCACESLDSWGRDLLNVPVYPPPQRYPAVASDALLCRVDRALAGAAAFTTAKEHRETSCGFFSFRLDAVLIVAISLGVLLLALLVLLVVCCRRRRRRRRRRSERWVGASNNNSAVNNRTPTVIRDISDDKEVQEALRRKPPRTQFKRQPQRQPQEEEERLQKGPFTLVVPDGRTYRETELHVIVERAEPLRPLAQQRLAQEPG